MASGDSLFCFNAHMNDPPSTNGATLNTRASFLLLEFDPSTAQSAFFVYNLPRNYSATTGITLTLCWAASGATTGDCVWGVSWARLAANVTDIDSLTFSTEVTATATTAGTDGAFRYTQIACTNGTQINSLAAGESFVLKIRRVAADAADTLSVKSQLLTADARDT